MISRILMAAAVSFLLMAPAHAEDAPAVAPAAFTFGIVDTDRVFKTCDAAKGVSEALEAKRKEFAAQIAKDQDALRKEGQKFEKEQAGLKKEEVEAKRKELSEKIYNLQKSMQGREHVLEKAFAQSLGTLRRETAQIVSEIAKERNYSVVFTQEAVMLSVQQMDITGEVITRLNKKVKKVPIDWSALAKEGKAG